MKQTKSTFNQKLLEKLMLAGWVSQLATVEKGPGQAIHGIAWTDDGLRAILTLGNALDSIEVKTGPMKETDFVRLFRLVRALPRHGEPSTRSQKTAGHRH